MTTSHNNILIIDGYYVIYLMLVKKFTYYGLVMFSNSLVTRNRKCVKLVSEID